MLHTHSKIWVHLVWVTKNREKCFFKEEGKILYKHLLNKAEDLKVPFERLNIQPEHIHGLINLPTDVLLCDFMKKIKGESSHWLNQNKIMKNHFTWQRGFGAFSVSASQLEVVKRYIERQQQHHSFRDFNNEYEEWKHRYGILDD